MPSDPTITADVLAAYRKHRRRLAVPYQAVRATADAYARNIADQAAELGSVSPYLVACYDRAASYERSVHRRPDYWVTAH